MPAADVPLLDRPKPALSLLAVAVLLCGRPTVPAATCLGSNLLLLPVLPAELLLVPDWLSS